MTICMIGTEVEKSWEVRWREVLTEHKEKGMEEQASHSENVSTHLIKAKRAKAEEKIIMTNKNIKISVQLSWKMQNKWVVDK